MGQGKLDDDTKNTYCQDSIDRIEGEESLWRETSKGARVSFLIAGEQLGATDESPDAVTTSIVELNATIAKATKIRQDEHLNGPVTLPVEDERLVLSGCGDDDSPESFPEQLPSPTLMQLRIGTSREELPTRQLVLSFGGRSADSTAIISLIMETAIAHRKGEHVLKEREALESSRPWMLRQRQQWNPEHQ